MSGWRDLFALLLWKSSRPSNPGWLDLFAFLHWRSSGAAQEGDTPSMVNARYLLLMEEFEDHLR